MIAPARYVEFVWVWVNDEDAEAKISRAVELGANCGAFAESIFPPVITFWFGAFPHFPNSAGARGRLVEELRNEFGEGAKAFHGRATAQLGNVGSKTRFAVALITVSRSALLTDLCALRFGDYREYEKKG